MMGWGFDYFLFEKVLISWLWMIVMRYQYPRVGRWIIHTYLQHLSRHDWLWFVCKRLLVGLDHQAMLGIWFVCSFNRGYSSVWLTYRPMRLLPTEIEIGWKRLCAPNMAWNNILKQSKTAVFLLAGCVRVLCWQLQEWIGTYCSLLT